MTILVTGGWGTVGRYLEESEFEEPVELVGRSDLDVTDLAAVQRRLASGRYSAVINLAALTDVDRCEREPELAYKVNAVGAWNLALAAHAAGVVLVQVSTTAVFGGDGADGPFSELDTPHPPNVYARTKLAGERYVQAHAGRWIVARTAWVMGGGPNDKKFVGKVRARLVAGHPVQAVEDQFGSPTYAADFTHALAQVLAQRAFGLYHMTSKGRASRYDMTLELARLVDSSSEISPVPAAFFPLDAPRSKSDVSTSLALPARSVDMPSWQDALRRYVESWD